MLRHQHSHSIRRRSLDSSRRLLVEVRGMVNRITSFTSLKVALSLRCHRNADLAIGVNKTCGVDCGIHVQRLFGSLVGGATGAGWHCLP